jgi:hypothetical protein
MLQSGNELDSHAHVYTYTEELHKSGLIRTDGHPETQKIRIIGFFTEIDYTGRLKSGCYHLQYVPASKPYDHA